MISVKILPAVSSDDIAQVRALFVEYVEWLGIDLSYQGFAAELELLPGCYAQPGGCILLAREDGEALGCVAVRPFNDNACEMKRLFVRASARGRGAE